MRRLATDVDPWLPSAMRATVTMLFYLPFFSWAVGSGKKFFPGWKQVTCLIGVSVGSQLLGNVAMQYSMGVVGVAITVPVCTGAMVIAATILARVFLKEAITGWMALAIFVLLVSIALFGTGSEAARRSMELSQLHLLRSWSALAGVVAAILSGIVFAALSVSIRSVLNRDIFRLMPIMAVTVTGVVVIWPGVFYRIGIDGLAEVAPWQWQLMVLAGLGNAAAFLCLATALKLLPVAWVNAINVSQVALAALLGVLLFSEPSSIWLWVGLLVMTAGFVLLGFRGNRFGNRLPETRSK